MKKNTGDFKTDLEQLLQKGNIIRLKPQGFSMYPLFIPGRDEALIQQVPVTSLKRNDVALYRRDQGILVLHRIVRVTADGYYMTGDNQYEIEGPLRPIRMSSKPGPVQGQAHCFCTQWQRNLCQESCIPLSLRSLASDAASTSFLFQTDCFFATYKVKVKGLFLSEF